MAESNRFFNLAALPILPGILGAGGWLAGMFLYPPLDHGEIHTAGAWAGGVLLVLYMVFAIYLMRGDPRVAPRAGIVLCMGIGGWGFFGVGLVAFGNGFFDGSPAVERTLTIREVRQDKRVLPIAYQRRSHWMTEAERRRRERSEATIYHAVVDSWREGRDYELLRVTEGNAASFQTNGTPNTIEATTRRGFFGLGWVEKHRIVLPGR